MTESWWLKGEPPPAIERPWTCSVCKGPPINHDDRQYGMCAGCALKSGERRKAARAEREAAATSKPKKGSK